MKFARMMAVTLGMLLAFGGCSSRNDNSGSASSPGILEEAGSAIENGAEELRSDLEEGMSRLEEDLHMDKSADENQSSVPEDTMSMDDESAAPAMSTDFSEIGALDGTPDNQFPGGPVDDKNRPSGPLDYQARYGKYDAHFIVRDSEKIFLTFDEGYENGYTSRILDTLKEKNVKAVFFITYSYAKDEPELVKRMIDEGHVLGNHSTAHKSYPSMPLAEAAEDLMKLHNYIKSNYGYEMYLFRPPEGIFSEQTLALAQKMGYKTMLWSFGYKDWIVDEQPLTLEANRTIVDKAHPGEIMLLHAVSQTNTEILGDVIDKLREKGFEFSDYFYLNPPKEEIQSESD